MEASIVDIRYKTKDIIKALENNENVNITYHGKLKGIISPAKRTDDLKVKNHPFFASQAESTQSVEDELHQLRGNRYDV
ncbi:MAG: type II toxin-antitoxin system Phd/YefM family antitoxin [Gammaproteobacteria bacterium]|nr:type II toxin-antitoxin system Phd/YefM family antitoxin [Gammaproteobacteria bacterium]